MAQHAGFAVAFSLGQAMVQNLIRILYNSRQLEPNVTLSTPGLLIKAFLSLPKVELSRANGNKIKITLKGLGPARISVPSSGTSRTTDASLRLVLLVSPFASITDGKLALQFDNGDVVISSFDLEPVDGAFTPDELASIGSKKVREAMTVHMRLALYMINQKIPELSLAGLGGIAKAEGVAVTTRVLNKELALGVDVRSGSLTTSGDGNLLGEFLGDDSLGFWINPGALSLFFADVTKRIRKSVEEKDAKLDSLAFTPSEGKLSIAGRGSATGGTATFSFDLIPTMDADFLTLTPSNIKIDVDRAWWAVVLEFAAFPFAVMAVESTVSAITGEIDYGIKSGSSEGTVRRKQMIWLAEIRQSVELTLERFTFTSAGVYLGSSFVPIFWKPTIFKLDQRGDAIERLNQPIRVAVTMPPGYHPDDPKIRLIWTLRNWDRSSPQFNLILASATTNSARITIPLALLNKVDQFAVDCDIRYVAAGVEVGPVVFPLESLRLIDRVNDDRLDRSHPFVRWTHEVITPEVELHGGGVRKLVGYNISKVRRSRIHRTDLGGRCFMAARFSKKLKVPEYLDRLPFTVEEADKHRKKLCDYCFFGGPDKSSLRVKW